MATTGQTPGSSHSVGAQAALIAAGQCQSDLGFLDWDCAARSLVTPWLKK